MADISFEEGNIARRYADQKPLFIRFVLATGIASSDKQAEYVLLGLAAVGLLVSFFLFSHSGPAQEKPTRASVEQMNQFMATTPSRGQ